MRNIGKGSSQAQAARGFSTGEAERGCFNACYDRYGRGWGSTNMSIIEFTPSGDFAHLGLKAGRVSPAEHLPEDRFRSSRATSDSVRVPHGQQRRAAKFNLRSWRRSEACPGRSRGENGGTRRRSRVIERLARPSLSSRKLGRDPRIPRDPESSKTPKSNNAPPESSRATRRRILELTQVGRHRAVAVRREDLQDFLIMT